MNPASILAMMFALWFSAIAICEVNEVSMVSQPTLGVLQEDNLSVDIPEL